MKTPLLAVTLALCLASPLWAQSDSGSTPPAPPTPPPDGGEHHWHGGPKLSPDERAKLKAAYEAALAANPDLKTQQEQLRQQMKDLEQKIHDAMVKADPTVEPVLAKLPHHGFGGPGGGPGGPPPAPPAPPTPPANTNSGDDSGDN